MIKNIDITGLHMKLDDKLRAYTLKKIGRLDRFVPRKAREALHVEVVLKDDEKPKNKKEYNCVVRMHLPKEKITISESTINPFAAIDIVEAKLKVQLKKYKETHGSSRLHRRMLSRIKRGRG